jgi:hypothetical protein
LKVVFDARPAPQPVLDPFWFFLAQKPIPNSL